MHVGRAVPKLFSIVSITLFHFSWATQGPRRHRAEVLVLSRKSEEDSFGKDTNHWPLERLLTLSKSSYTHIPKPQESRVSHPTAAHRRKLNCVKSPGYFYLLY